MKCLFDNNMSPKLAKALNYLEGDKGITIEHLTEKFSNDTPDIEWLKILSKEGSWFAITQDNRIKKSSTERKIWKESKIPIIFLHKTWIKQNFWEITWRLIKYWPKIKEVINTNKKCMSFEININGKIIEIE